MHDLAQSPATPSDAQTMKQLGVVILSLVGVALALIVAVSIVA